MGNVRRRIDTDKDALILVTGEEGVGKSNLCLGLGMLLDRHFGVDRITFNETEFIRRATRTPPGGVVTLDEAVKGAFKRMAMSKSNKELVQFLTVCRSRNLIMLLLIPSRESVDQHITEHRAAFWVHVEARGVFTVYQPQRAEFAKRTFWEKLFTVEGVPPITGEPWDGYQAKKDAFVGAHGRRSAEEERVMVEVVDRVRSVVGRIMAWRPGQEKKRGPESKAEAEERRAWEACVQGR